MTTGYLYLILTILATAWIMIGLRELKRWNINLLQAITWNYIAAAALGFVQSPAALTNVASESGALAIGLYLGVAFIALFFLMGTVAQKVGVGYMTVVTKMSLVIPTLFAWQFYGDEMTWIKGVGMALAIGSVILINYRPGDPVKLSDSNNPKAGWMNIALIVVLFIGSGINDLLFKVFGAEYNDTISSVDFPVVIFSFAGAIGVVICAYQILAGKVTFETKAILGGVIIGLPNFFSILGLVESLNYFPGTVFFPVNNTALLVVTALVGILVYKEKFNLFNAIGLGLAVAAVLLLV